MLMVHNNQSGKVRFDDVFEQLLSSSTLSTQERGILSLTTLNWTTKLRREPRPV
jgi:hypothetical protein